MDGMVNAELPARAERTYRDITSQPARFPTVDVDDARSLAIGVAEETTRSTVGYMLMRLRGINQRVDSLELDRFIDRQAASVGLSNVSPHGFTSHPAL
ncbi:hypothetical protein OVA26_16045 [Microbacterium sp. SL62]|uniref:hypothetical protein n=1 Tax=Microbacterium sp. SL62 TaxID=2995139 RepID=UPI002273F0BF|nr:hypothetical protein [Microbacterium sp. SL62]MCY1718447.1 hypothetical protein [Microbacterium sp. SL62]